MLKVVPLVSLRFSRLMKGRQRELILRSMALTTSKQCNGQVEFVQQVVHTAGYNNYARVVIGNLEGEIMLSWTWAIYIMSLMTGVKKLTIHWVNRYSVLGMFAVEEGETSPWLFFKELKSLEEVVYNPAFDYNFTNCIPLLPPSLKTVNKNPITTPFLDPYSERLTISIFEIRRELHLCDRLNYDEVVSLLL